MCLLRKSIYRLKEAPQLDFKNLQNLFCLKALPTYAQIHPSFFFFFHKNFTWIYFLVYVDDMLISGSDPSAISSLIHVTSACFSIKDLGPLSFFLDVKAVHTSDSFFFSQHQYSNDLPHKFWMHEAKLVATLLTLNVDLYLLFGATLSYGLNYQQLIRSLYYLVLTFPNMSFCFNKLAQFMHRPTKVHWQMAKWLLCYL